MTGQPDVFPTIPNETARSAMAVFGPSNFYIQVGERLKVILEKVYLECFVGGTKKSMARGWILPLATFFEFVEGLTDAQAADALRTRIDWKYALHLPMNPAVLRPTTLCEFRNKIFIDSICQGELQLLVDRLIEFHPSANGLSKNIEVLTLLLEICLINRLHWVQEAMYQALGVLASKYPEWLRQVALPHWYGKFSNLSSRPNQPMSMRQQELAIQKLGTDIQHLLEEVHQSNLSEINELQEILALQQIWELQYEKPNVELKGQRETSTRLVCDACINRAV